MARRKEKIMWKKSLLMAAAIMIFLAACGVKVDKPVSLLDHEGNAVTVPGEKPILFFFITTYT